MSNFSQSRLAAKLQEYVSGRREETGLYREIAEKLPLQDKGRTLDVGTGTGLQLKVIHEMRPGVELYGLDISEAAIRMAESHLDGLGIDLRAGSIENTNFDKDFFDIVTCNSSMSYWDEPVACFDEIYRILKPGGCTALFEPQKDIDMDEVVEILKKNLADVNPLRRALAISVNKYGLQYGRKIGLTLYSVEELKELASKSRFGENARIERTTLQNLPIFVQIILMKPNLVLT